MCKQEKLNKNFVVPKPIHAVLIWKVIKMPLGFDLMVLFQKKCLRKNKKKKFSKLFAVQASYKQVTVIASMDEKSSVILSFC